MPISCSTFRPCRTCCECVACGDVKDVLLLPNMPRPVRQRRRGKNTQKSLPAFFVSIAFSILQNLQEIGRERKAYKDSCCNVTLFEDKTKEKCFNFMIRLSTVIIYWENYRNNANLKDPKVWKKKNLNSDRKVKEKIVQWITTVETSRRHGPQCSDITQWRPIPASPTTACPWIFTSRKASPTTGDMCEEKRANKLHIIRHRQIAFTSVIIT